MIAAMIDIEALDEKDSAVIVSVGMVVFDPNRTDSIAEYYDVCDILDQPNRTIDISTTQWWLRQSQEAQDVFDEEAAPLVTVLTTLFDTLALFELDQYWAKSPDFDLNILEHAAEQLGLKVPWNFRQRRDVRTIQDLLPPGMVRNDIGVKHNALDDARAQAGVVQTAYALVDQSLQQPEVLNS